MTERLLEHQALVAPAGTSQPFYRASLPKGRHYSHRDQAIRAVVPGRRVVHVGCTDWPLTEERLEQGDLLHQKLMGWCPDVLGVDVDGNGLELLGSALGGRYERIDVSDEDLGPLVDFGPELIVACDVIEHVPNIEAFLRGLRGVMERVGPGTRLFLTTPNSLALRNIVYTAAGVEVIHPDHRVVFTPRTLARCLRSQNLEVTEWGFYSIASGESWSRRALDRVARLSAGYRPALADGLAVTAEVR